MRGLAVADHCGCPTLVDSLQSSGVQHIFAVAGRPITHIAECASVRHAGFEWSVNEKVALESAVGLSALGVRTAVLIKQCGLNVALDSLVNAVYHTTNGALLIVVGDDVGATSSTCEQDSRDLARAARVPVIEPRNGADIVPTVDLAVRLGETAATPVMIRLVNDVHNRFVPSEAMLGAPASLGRSLPDVAFALTKLGRQQYHRTITWPSVGQVIDASRAVQTVCSPTCTTGVLAVGAASMDGPPAGSACCWATTSVSWPLPARVLSFVRSHPDLLVLEEPTPFVERELVLFAVASQLRVTIRGRLTGHLPPEGPLQSEHVTTAIRSTTVAADWSVIERKRATTNEPSPPYDALFRAVARARRRGAFVAADVGSAVKLCYQPYQGADVSLSLGSAIGVAGGAARTGRPSIAVIGDFALLHSGLEALVDIARHDLPVVVLVLLNGVQAQTGGQPSGTVASQGALPELIAATGVGVVADFDYDDHDEDSLHDLLTSWLASPVPTAALIRQGAGVQDVVGELGNAIDQRFLETIA